MKYITVKEYAQKYNLNQGTVRKYCSKKKIKGAYKDKRKWLIPSEVNYLTNNRLHHVSLFSGCGGMDLGFEGGFPVHNKSIELFEDNDLLMPHKSDWSFLPYTGIKTIFANDIRPGAKKVWDNYFDRKYNNDSVYRLESIVNIVREAKRNGENPFGDNVDIVTGGFPCQDFSLSGKRRGFKSNKDHNGNLLGEDVPSIETRGQLYIWMREVIDIVQPKVFIAENVKGLVNLKDVKDVIENDFRNVAKKGYIVVPARVVNAANYGVPQSRERVFFIGFNKSKLNPEAVNELQKEIIESDYDPYPPITHSSSKSKDYAKNLRPFVDLKSIFSDLDEPELSLDIEQQKYSKAKFMGNHCQGQTEVKTNFIAPTIRAEHHGNIEFRRLSLENGGKNTDEIQAGLKERRLTIRECARIQTFPDNFKFIQKNVSASEAYKLIGNAVPPLLAFHIARNLVKKWDVYFKEGL